jgi:hypothetical protein
MLIFGNSSTNQPWLGSLWPLRPLQLRRHCHRLIFPSAPSFQFSRYRLMDEIEASLRRLMLKHELYLFYHICSQRDIEYTGATAMADEHSEPGGMKVRRLYVDALGESRFETTTMPMALKEFAPPAAPLRVSAPQPAENYVVLEVGAKWGGAVPHPSPARMMAFSLSGCTRVTASSGETHTFVAGDCLLHDDTSGKGHSTEVISNVPARWVFIRLPN